MLASSASPTPNTLVSLGIKQAVMVVGTAGTGEGTAQITRAGCQQEVPAQGNTQNLCFFCVGR